MEIATFFNSKGGDRKYNATHWANYFKPLFKSGVFNGDLQVTANGNMSVTVATGHAWLEGYGYNNTEPLVIDLETASGNLNRYDAIKIKLDLSERTIKAYAQTGANATSPVKPTNERSDTVFEVTIAEVYVKAGTTAITQSMITDTRMNSSKCGWVAGAVDQITYDQMYAQLQQYFVEQQEEFDEWFDFMKDQLSEDAAGNLQNQIDAHKANKENPHAVTKAQVGLGNVDNTSDKDKPISTATQKALNELEENVSQRLPLSGGTLSGGLNASKGIVNHSWKSNKDAQGYIKIASIVIPASYMDSPIEFDVITRNASRSTKVSLLFSGVSGNDPSIKSFEKVGPHNIYINKSATSTWDIYVKTNTVYEMIAISNLTYGSQFVEKANTFINYENSYVASLPAGYVEATMGTVSMISERAIKDKNGNDINGTYALKAALTSAGIDANILQSNNVGSALSFNDLIKKRTVTFFTNWNDTTNFPAKYGSGVLIPALDATNKMIYYQVKNEAWFGFAILESDTTTLKSLTWNNISKIGKTVWQNANPTENFAATTISLSGDQSAATHFEIIYKHATTINTIGSTGKLPFVATENECVLFIPYNNNNGDIRNAIISKTKIEFKASCNYAGGGQSDVMCIPLKVLFYYG